MVQEMSRNQVTQITRIIVATMLIAALTTAILSYLSYGLMRGAEDKYQKNSAYYQRNIIHVFALQRQDAVYGLSNAYSAYLLKRDTADIDAFYAILKDTRTLLSMLESDATRSEDTADYATITSFVDDYEAKFKILENVPPSKPLTPAFLTKHTINNESLNATIERLEIRWQKRIATKSKNMRESLSSARLFLEAQIVVVPILLLLFLIIAFFVRAAARAFTALSDSRARYRALIDISGDPIISVNESLLVITFNKGAEQTFGHKAEDVLGQHLNMLIPHRYRERHDVLMSKFITSPGKTISMGDWRRVTGLRSNGSEFPFMSSISKIDDGQRIVMTLMMRDMSQVQAREAELEESYEKALAANQAKSMFLAMISHELRTPMNAITGFCNLLQRSELPEKETEYVGYIDSASQNLLHIINDILDHVKLETGNMELLEVDMSPKEVAESVYHMLQPLAQQKEIGLELEMDSSIPDTLTGDRGRLRQILTNLMGNAIKFTDQGQVNITVTNEDVSDGRIWVRFRIKDTGIGIPANQVDTIFESFFQVSDPMQFRSGGTGLGLTISRNFVQLMGGTINVDSKVDEGSTFDVLIPFTLNGSHEQSDDPAHPTSAVSDKTHNNTNRSLNILLAEDNLLNQKLFSTVIESLGHVATIVDNGEDAVTAVQDGAFDMILMDISMPKMDGVEATNIIRSMKGDVAQTPIIALTAHTNLNDPKFIEDAGFDELITKPASDETLQKAIERAMSKGA